MNGLELFGIGFPELVTILIIAGLVMGPQRIAKFARQLGQWTAQLQNISRGFMRQLTSELDAEEMADLKDAMSEIKDLRQQLTDLRGEMTAVAAETSQEMKEVAEDLDPSILPPDAKPNAESINSNGSEEAVPKENGEVREPSAIDQLPNILDIEDDPES
ncbi:MAG: twin-arginine translocase TatA/TatE family subunit [Chloroflexota bacterium]